MPRANPHSQTNKSAPRPRFNRQLISSWLSEDVIAQGQHYVTGVRDMCWPENNHLCGRVTDGRLGGYVTRVLFSEQFSWIRSSCSCSIGTDCAHVAALLLASLGGTEPPRKDMRPDLANWLEELRTRRAGESLADNAASRQSLALVYLLEIDEQHLEVALYKARRNADGTIRVIEERWNNVESAFYKPPKFIGRDDAQILNALLIRAALDNDRDRFVLSGGEAATVLQMMVETGRAFAIPAARHSPIAFRIGAPRLGKIEWHPKSGDTRQPLFQTDPRASRVFRIEPPWYIDTGTHEAGLVKLPFSLEEVEHYLSMPAISVAEAPLVGDRLREISPDLPVPPGHDSEPIREIVTPPRPILSLDSVPYYLGGRWGRRNETAELDCAVLRFAYGDVIVAASDDKTLQKTQRGEVVRLRRYAAKERKYNDDLTRAGFGSYNMADLAGPLPFPGKMLGMHKQDQWPRFMKETLPALRNDGWRILIAESFNHNQIEADEIVGTLSQAGDGWFDVEMGIKVDNRVVRLEPLLADLFQRDHRWLSGELNDISDDEIIELKNEQGEKLVIRAERLKPVVRVLVDLFEAVDGGPIRIPTFDAGRIDALGNIARWEFHGEQSIRQLAQRLQAAPGLVEARVPSGLQTELRAYQHQGLNWMQFLRAHGLSGVLADEMGLGKTVQTLAHVLAEKEAGRLDRPALIVVPTTLVHNWREEAQRFTPDLKVLDLNGPQRRDRFEQIEQHDLVLTTYALLWRDQEALSAHSYHLLILDEAQYVKNAGTRAGTTIRHLKARHRLCLTGTPLENHLGELWAQFDFLLPGFLGSHQEFTKRWRTPIEKGGDNVRRELLRRRTRPFILRRLKDEVATQLPAKTIIVRNVDLEGTQRDLYETVRAAMHKKVRAAVNAQGLSRSHIIVLDALLKLRQVCCDPRLVKLDKASEAHESAKLDLLLAMLRELIDEGRRVLLFSQFTGMLSLIAAALDDAAISYVTLTGDTTDRVTPVQRFQRCEVPLFLISLKAGGVGLNLTAADTVIHYDPWWNPAAENQATDRAHRIGQDKPVFVYKLIAAGSIEEKIVALQEKKAQLAKSILSEDAAGIVKFSQEDIEGLFAPITTSTPLTRRGTARLPPPG